MSGKISVTSSDNYLNHKTDDEFSYSTYAQALADTLKDTELPFCLGIFGSWGQGKTSLMRLIQELLAPNADEHTYKSQCIWFDAWKYDKEESVWRALLVQCVGDIQRQLEIRSNELDEEDGKNAIEDFLNKSLLPLKDQLYRSFSRTEKGDLNMDWGGLLTQVAVMGVSTTLPGGSLATRLFNLLKGEETEDPKEKTDNIKADVKSVEKILGCIRRESCEHYFEHIRHIEQFNEAFADLVEQSLALLDSERLVIFIDDLDRCEPKKVIEVLEAIKLFLETDKTAFVIGVDDEVVHAGLKHRYGSELAKLYPHDDKHESETQQRPYHIEYLEKIIQLPFTLPALLQEDVRNYVIKRLPKDIDENVQRCLVDFFCDICQFNPRKIKRLCNLLDLNWRIAKQREKEYEERYSINSNSRFNILLLAKLVVIQSQYRELYYKLLDKKGYLLVKMEEEISQRAFESGFYEGESGGNDDLEEVKMKRGSVKDKNIDTYLNVDWLHELLTWPSINSYETYFVTSFKGTIENNGSVDQHLQLQLPRRTTSDLNEDDFVHKENLDRLILSDLMNEDRNVIASSTDRLSVDDRKIYARYMVQLLDTAKGEDKKQWRVWVAAGDALGYLGDPRLEKSIWERENYWITIPEGEFFRGTRVGDRGATRNNVDGNRRRLEAFDIAKFQVTNKDWLYYVQEEDDVYIPDHWSDGKPPWGLHNHPVVNVSWFYAKAFVQWLNRKSNDDFSYCLPTEAQWEKAARGAAILNHQENRRLYPWGDDFNHACCNSGETGTERTTAVGAFPLGASLEGVMDMSGNVWEWCQDKYGNYYYENDSIEVNEEGNTHVVRGGSFINLQKYASCVYRRNGVDARGNTQGFRIARTKKT